ncbi:Sigma factor binding protein 2 [Hibiscus syriacus]|uniref:Sigma factor binding protein 2 n=1 Tax=Hibiscus syriacus TaxID=106335 RepID=A0A6A2Y2K1_HIBSY|nr:Sigma factor binding protein 2 [Hibiscus syriacus]
MDDSISSTLQTRNSSPKKTKFKKPIKVVYISNPMKVTTSASEFMALVQKLTGQDAELPEDPTKFTDAEEAVDDVGGDIDNGNQRVPDTAAKNDTVAEYRVKEIPSPDQQQCSTIADDVERSVPFDAFYDDVFTQQMIENFTGISPQGHFI